MKNLVLTQCVPKGGKQEVKVCGGDKLSATKKKDALWGNGEKEQLCTISFENCSLKRLKRSKMHVFMFHSV